MLMSLNEWDVVCRSDCCSYGVCIMTYIYTALTESNSDSHLSILG